MGARMRWAVVFLLLAQGHFLVAQTAKHPQQGRATVRELIYGRVQSVEAESGGKVKLTFDRGALHGLWRTPNVLVYSGGKYDPASGALTGEHTLLARGQVADVRDNDATALVTLTPGAAGVHEGDVVSVWASAPAVGYRPVTWEAARYHATLRNKQGQPYLSYESLYRGEPAEATRQLLVQMADEVNKSAGDPGLAQFAAARKCVPGERFNNGDLRAALAAARPYDALMFLGYVAHHEQRYGGIDAPFTGVFRDWVCAGAPSSPLDLTYTVGAMFFHEPDLTPSKPDSKTKEDGAVSMDPEMAITAIDWLRDRGRTDAARRLAEFWGKVRLLNAEDVGGDPWLAQGYVEELQDRRGEQAAACEKAVAAFEAEKKPSSRTQLGLARSLQCMASGLLGFPGRVKDASGAANRAVALLEQLQRRDLLLGRAYETAAEAFGRAETPDYEKALAYLDKAAALYTDLNEPGKLAGMQFLLGRLYLTRKDLGSFLKSYSKTAQLLLVSGDEIGAAEMLEQAADEMLIIDEPQAAIKTYGMAFEHYDRMEDSVHYPKLVAKMSVYYLEHADAEQAHAVAGKILDMVEVLARTQISEALAGLKTYCSYVAEHKYPAEALRTFEAAEPMFPDKAESRAARVELLFNIAELKIDLKDYPGALDSGGKTLDVARALKDGQAEAATLLLLGRVQHLLKHDAEAIALYRQAQAIFAQVSNVRDEAYAWELMGQSLGALHQNAEAVAAFGKAVELYKRIDATEQLAAALLNRGAAAWNMRDYQSAVPDLENALAMQKDQGAWDTAIETLDKLSSASLTVREFARAEKYARQELQLAEQFQKPGMPYSAHRTLAAVLSQQYRHTEAQQQYDAALKLAGDDESAAALVKAEMSDDRKRQGKYDEAVSLATSALQVLQAERSKAVGAREISLGEVQRKVTGALASMYEESGDSDKALAGINVLVKLSQDDKERESEGRAYIWLLQFYCRRGQAGIAFEYGQKARQILTELKVDDSLIDVLNELGTCALAAGDTDQALTFLNDALRQAQEMQDQQLLQNSRHALSQAHLQSGNLVEAQKHLQAALASAERVGDRRQISYLLYDLARILMRQARQDAAASGKLLADADAALARAEKLYTPQGLQRCLLLKERGALALERGQLDEARSALQEALTIAEKAKARHLSWELHYLLSRVEEKQNKPQPALEQRRRSIAVLEEIGSETPGGESGRLRFLAGKVEVYESMEALLARMAERETDPAVKKQLQEEALRYVGMARLQQQRELARDAGPGGDAKSADKLLLQQRNLDQQKAVRQAAQMEGNTALVESLNKIVARGEAELADMFDEYKSKSDLDSPFDPRQLNTDAVPEHTALLVYFPGEKYLDIWLYTRQGFQSWSRRQVTREELYGLVDQYHALIREFMPNAGNLRISGFGPQAERGKNPEWYTKNIAALRENLSKLNDHLLGPVAAQIADTDELLILPYGKLFFLPFEALVSQNGDTVSFLGQRKKVAYFISEKNLARTLQRAQGADKTGTGENVWLGFAADPMGDLPSSYEEVKRIAEFFPKNRVFFRDQANVEQISSLPDECTILHFATHGILDSSNVSRTYLQLSSPPGDGHLSQASIRRLGGMPCFRSKRLKLVTLSACDTAAGQQLPTNQTLGMPDAFDYLHVPSVLASLWKVDSDTTTKLMIDFYERYTRQQQDKATALHQAKLAVITGKDGQKAHPFFWAPFILFGDWK